MADNFQLLGIDPDIVQDKSSLDTLKRSALRTGARIGEIGGGLPGSIEAFGKSVVPNPFAQAQPGQGQEFLQPSSQWPSLSELVDRSYKEQQEQPQQRFLPTPEELRENVTKRYTGEYLEPQNEYEKFADEVVQDIAAILHPLLPGAATGIKEAGAMGALGNIAKYGAQKLGLGKTGQENAKLGTMLLTNLGFKPNLEKTAKQAYEVAQENIPDVEVSSQPLNKAIARLEDLATRPGIATPSKKFALERIPEIQEVVRDGKISARDAFEGIKDINELFREDLIPNNAKSHAGELIDAFSETLNPLEKTHPDFHRAFESGRGLYKAINTSSGLNSWIQDKLGILEKKVTHPLALHFIGLGKAVGGTLGMRGIGYIANTADRLFANPAVRNDYINFLEAASKKNIGSAIKYATKLDEDIKKAEADEYQFLGID
jgi:hypothetical protein